MTRLLVQSCSKTKNTVSQPAPPLDVYDGYFFRILNKAIEEDDFRSDIDICVLSAKYGILSPTDDIINYDLEMTRERANDLRKAVQDTIVEKMEQGAYSAVVINVGKDYYPALRGVEKRVDVPVVTIEGSGIGEKGNILKQFVRGQIAVNEIGD